MPPFPQRRLMSKPAWVLAFERRLAVLIPLPPNALSAAKLFFVAPLLIMALRQVGTLPHHPWLVALFFLCFSALDYLDGVVARHRDLESGFGRVFDRVTDYPVLFALSLFCIDILPLPLLGAKLALDLLLAALYLLGRGSTENRLRTGMSNTTLLALLFVSQGWMPRLITPEVVAWLLGINIAFTSVVALYNLRILQKRFIADALSGANLLCGVASMLMASRGRYELSLLFLMLGAGFDGFDGAAARKFGGTRWGVYSDDVADAVNYGIAPGVALWFALGGAEGLAVGAFYSLFTLGRLVYFTLNKDFGDPAYFAGVPSTVGGLVTLGALVLFEQRPVLLGLAVGIACVQMVSFDTHYRHLGRALASNRRIIYGMPAALLLLLLGLRFQGPELPIGIIVAAALIYGFLPTAVHFRQVLARRALRAGDGSAQDGNS